jgi:hypothetical protein
MKWSDGRHPIWTLARTIVLTFAAMAILDRTASHFDAGEVTAAVGVGGSVLAFDIIKRLFTNNS